MILKDNISDNLQVERRNQNMEKRMNREEIIKLIESLKIDKNEYWILSSGALVIRGIYPDAGDLDIAVTERIPLIEEYMKNNYKHCKNF